MEDLKNTGRFTTKIMQGSNVLVSVYTSLFINKHFVTSPKLAEILILCIKYFHKFFIKAIECYWFYTDFIGLESTLYSIPSAQVKHFTSIF